MTVNYQSLLAPLCLLIGLTLTNAGTARSDEHLNTYQVQIEDARETLAEKPDDAAALRRLAAALLAVGDPEGALATYEQIPPGGDARPLDVDIEIARIEQRYRAPGEAKPRLVRILENARARRDALSANELWAAAGAARALAADDSGLFREALDLLEAAIRLAPAEAKYPTAIGDLLLDRYNSEEALNAFRAALEIDPQYRPALLGIARSQYFDRSGATLAMTDRILEENPDYLEALILKTRLQIEAEDYPGARETLARAIAINPRFPPAQTLDAALTFLEGDEDALIPRVEALLAEAPGYTAAYATLAELLAQNRRYDRAADLARRGVAHDRSVWNLHALLGNNRLRLGRISLGRASLEAAFRGDPYNPWTKNTLALLDKVDGFSVYRSQRFELVAAPNEATILAPRVLALAEAAYDEFAESYGYRPRTPIRIELYPSHEDFSVRTIGLVGVDIIGVSFGPVVALDSPTAARANPLNFGSVLWHEIAHTFHLGMTSARVPRWFSEGLAVFEEHRASEGWGTDVSIGFLKAFGDGRLPPVSRLNQSFLRPTYPEQIIHGYYQASLLMALIEKERGFEAIVEMLRGFSDGQELEYLVRGIMGWSPEDLDAAFEAYVEERYGHAIKALSDDPSAVAGAPRAPYLRALYQAEQAIGEENFEAAERALKEAQGLFPELAGMEGSYWRLAALYQRQGQHEKAAAQLRENIRIDADDLEAHVRLASLYQQLDDPAAAAEVLERSLFIEPFRADVYAELASIYESLDLWGDAVGHRRTVMEMDPADPIASRYQLALAHFRYGDRVTARRELLTTLESAPLYDEALQLLLDMHEQETPLERTEN